MHLFKPAHLGPRRLILMKVFPWKSKSFGNKTDRGAGGIKTCAEKQEYKLSNIISSKHLKIISAISVGF